ncbi:cytolethal distending toxin subunit B-like [Eupeodes corollae]|uniref:cytolethal distending toxin subunit B-like n=1 Tax=Eupeodes corollae TaxID=290404 RepID=UPI0024911C6D|nr:cytolethal distending toxin subunit B-like [Eupeodes corollae]
MRKMLLIHSFLGVFISCSVLTAAQIRNVHNFKIASWNTNGDRWKSVKRIMDSEAIDVMGVQEAGKMPIPLAKVFIIGHVSGRYQENEIDIAGNGITEMMLENTYYVYYYDRTCPTSDRAQTKKQNMAIVSRERATEVFLLPPETRRNSRNKKEAECDERLFINRPTLGIRIGNAYFFTLHTEPTLQNEADLILNEINRFMNQVHPQATWILMGDFNRAPNTVLGLTQLGSSMKPEIISSIKKTRGDNVYDYGIVGGPERQATSMKSMQVKVLPDRLNGGVGGELASDHKPVVFYTLRK